MPHPVLTARQGSHPLTSVFWYMVPGGGIEPPTRGFSIPLS